jgi:transposase
MKLDKKRDAYVVTGFTDMRKQINGLARIVQDLDIKGPFTGNYYLFLGKTRRVMKILYWDDSGFCLWAKRLEDDHFPWPDEGEALAPVARDQVLMILKGIDVWKRHKKLNYTRVA